MAEQVTNNQVSPQGEQKPKVQKRPRTVQLESKDPVKIADLQPRNNNSNFVGKVIEVQVLEKGNNKQGNPRKFLKGLIGDDTGVVRFDLAVKNDVVFKVDDVVSFDKAMNKVNKDGHHYIEVKRFGKYEITNGSIAAVKTDNNISTKIIPPLPEGEKKQKIIKKSNNKQNNNGKVNNNNNNGDNNTNNNGNKMNNRPYKKQNYNQQRKTNNNNNNNSNNNTNNSQNFKNYKQKPKRFHQALLTPIKNLKPGQNGQTVKGKVFDVQSYQKTIKNREATFFKGRVADDTANINFDFMMKEKTISEGDMVIFTNIMNKVSETGHHYIVVGKYGNYSVLNEKQININEQENKSSIEYAISSSNNATKQ
ncbi:G-quartet DNA-binding protein, putative (macronuclear) [Tetrahymena thermophila SB210]|uniref:G-quartet DNA-binding protein, putative n=1 Tax=Tetrahymena thermophila (strain SB210) TaxID=312017 RepID=I7LWI6_TETTS|nr:G-quartet DNA-binding protein, putative [Tetrahymena thermophila SB210]EAS01957.1 G-quartet DNA-binding protein, putative [Tetrahymena thermophila SB210]|eukprot:XP_001022202.1 G-quartet DNA-binding protein, putative [Tetrahymena thermophila SB210]